MLRIGELLFTQLDGFHKFFVTTLDYVTWFLVILRGSNHTSIKVIPGRPMSPLAPTPAPGARHPAAARAHGGEPRYGTDAGSVARGLAVCPAVDRAASGVPHRHRNRAPYGT